MTNRRWSRGLGVCVAVFGLWNATRQAEAQLIAVTVKSTDDLLSQVRTLAKAAGPEAFKQVVDSLDALENGGVLKWLDRNRPIAATAGLTVAGQGAQVGLPFANLFLPINNRDDFLDALKQLGFAVDDKPGVEGFSHKIVRPGGEGIAFYLLATPLAGYAVLTTAPGGAAALRAVKPDDLKPTRPGVLLASVRIDRFPPDYKRMLLSQIKQRNTAQRERKEGESDAAYAGRMAGITFVEDQFTALVRDGRELSLDANVDRDKEKFTLTMGLDALPDTRTAEALGALGTRQSRFLGVSPDAAVILRGVLPIPAPLRAQIKTAIESGRAQAGKDLDLETRQMIGLMFDALTPTLTGETIDACMTMEVVGGKEKTNVVLFGVAVEGAEKVEAALREAIAKSKPEERKKIALDHSRVERTAVHRVMLDPETVKPEEFGEPLMFLAFPEGAALATVGGQGLGTISQAITAIGKPAAAGPQVVLDVAAARFARLNNKDNQAAFQEAADEVFKGADATKDRLHLGLTGATGRATLKLDADLPVIRFLVQVGIIQQQQAREGKAR